MRRSELGRLRLLREERERKRKEQEAEREEPKEEAPIPKPVLASELRRLGEQRAERARLERERPIRRRTPTPSPPKVNVVRNRAITDINDNITPIITEEVNDLEPIALSFANNADGRNIEGMLKDLERFEMSLVNITDLLKQFNKKILDVFGKTKAQQDIKIIVNETFKPDDISKAVVAALRLLEGAAEATLEVRFDVPGAKQPLEILQRIQELGQKTFREYKARPIEIEMDVSKDVEMAKMLAGGAPQELKSRFDPIGGVDSGIGLSRRRGGLTRPIPEVPSRGLALEDALSIVDEYTDVDDATLRAILLARGFDEVTVREALKKKRGEGPLMPSSPRRRRPLPAWFSTERPTLPAVILPPPSINMLTVKDLVNIAKTNGLTEYRRKTKPNLIRYLEANIDRSILANAVRAKMHNYKFTNIPVIQTI